MTNIISHDTDKSVGIKTSLTIVKGQGYALFLPSEEQQQCPPGTDTRPGLWVVSRNGIRRIGDGLQPAVPPPNPNLDYALAYARMGWPVIPCHWIWEHAGENRCSCNKPDCDSPGKHPIGHLVPHGLKEATTDPETIRKWWERYPVANIAVVTGEASGIVAIDLDIKDGKDGQVALEKWCYDNGVTLPETITQQTGSGGLHYLFRYPAGMDINGATDVLRNGTGIDVRGQNGYIMVEPSENAGGQYSWIADNDPFSGATPAELPPKLLELIGSRKRASAPSGAGVGGAKWIVHEETVQEVIDALKSIPADNYQRWIDQKTGEERLGWIEIGLAIKAMGLGERGFQIWDEWSQKSSKYAENPPGLMQDKWRSFKPTDITHLSIFNEAQKYGWINPQSTAAAGGMAFDPETGEVLEPGDVFEVLESSSDEDRALAYEVRELLKSVTPDSSIPDSTRMASEIVGWGVYDKLGSKNIALGLAVCGEWDDRHKAEIEEMQGISSVDAYHIARNTKTGNRIGYGSLVMLAKESPVAYVDDCDDEGESIEDIEDEKIFPEIPPNLLTIPGVLGYAVDWINATSVKPQPALAVQTALAFGSTVLGRRYRTDNDNWSSLYFLNIADSGSGKEYAKLATERMLESSEHGYLLGPDCYTSESAVLSALVHKPCHITIIDEFGKELKKATNPRNTHAQGMLKKIMEVFGRCSGVMRPTGYSTAFLNERQRKALSERIVRNPALTILGMSTPGTFFGAVNGDGVVDGFLNRFLTVHSDIGRQMARTDASNAPVPTIVTDWAKAQRDASMGGRQFQTELGDSAIVEAQPVILPITPIARRLFSEFERQNVNRANELDREGLGDMMTRCTEIAMRLSVIVARSLQQDHITEDAAAWSIEYVKTHTERNINQLRHRLAENEHHALCMEVYRLIERSGDKGITQRELGQKSRKFAAERPNGKKEVLENVLRMYPVSVVPKEKKSGRGPRTDIFMLNKFRKGKA